MKTILKVNFFFYIVFLIAIFTGNFKFFITITLITIFHELGHILTGLMFKYHIEEIRVMPFGLVTIFNKKINEPFLKDLLLTLAGPLFQIFLFVFINDLQVKELNKFLLFFNLLPIIPLDGSKILNLLLENFFSYKQAYTLTFVISILSLILLIRRNLLVLIIVFLYSIYNYKYIKNIYYYFNKFLLERYLNKINYRQTNNINGRKMKKMKKFRKNIFISSKIIENEEDFLNVMFDNR